MSHRTTSALVLLTAGTLAMTAVTTPAAFAANPQEESQSGAPAPASSVDAQSGAPQPGAADEAGAEEAEAATDADEAGEQTAGETPEEPSETAADVAVDSEAGRVEGDEEDPETKATRREGLN